MKTNRGFQKGHKINIGRKYSKERDKKISLALTGKPKSEEHKQALSLSHKDKPRPWQVGKHRSEKTKNKMSLSHKGISPSKKTRKLMSEAHKGEKSYLWRGGISFEPYSTDWTQTLKRSIRERDHYICQLCLQEGCSVHHIDYNKKNCNPNNLITLCVGCNSKVNSNRNYWQEIFTQFVKNVILK